MTRELAALRRKRGITVEQLAERLDTAVQNVNRLEKGQNITLRTLARWAQALGVRAEVHFTADPRGPRTPPPGRGRKR